MQDRLNKIYRELTKAQMRYSKLEKVCSNTQLYKQAGNSIVVNVLEEILYNLLIEDYKYKDVQLNVMDL